MKTLIILLLFCSNCYAFDDWSKTDYALQGVYTVLHVMDWGQTLNISKNPITLIQEGDRQGTKPVYRELSEKNIILGKHPSQKSVNTYFIGMLLLHTAVSYVLPSTYRTVWQCVTIGFESISVSRNFSAGVKMTF